MVVYDGTGGPNDCEDTTWATLTVGPHLSCCTGYAVTLEVLCVEFKQTYVITAL